MTRASDQVAAAVAEYAPVLHGAVDTDHHVASPLGAWLLLALAGAAGADDGTLEAALGMPAPDAAHLADRLLRLPHPAVAAGVGLWWRGGSATDRLLGYAGSLPRGATREELTDQARLDAWTAERSLGLIPRFPLRITPDLVVVLASVLATKVRWIAPFDVVASADVADDGWAGGFADTVGTALRTPDGQHEVRAVTTRAAGLVGVHVVRSSDGLAVVSVLGAPDAGRAAVLDAAHEVALRLDPRGSVRDRVSLFDLPLGPLPIGAVAETATTSTSTERERGDAVLPSWRAETSLDLTRGATGPAFAAAARRLAGLTAAPGAGAARQVATASYDRAGFEAAAVSGLAMRIGRRAADEIVVRSLRLRFTRPYAVVAVAVEPLGGRFANPAWIGLPVFSAWVAQPTESA